LADVFLLGCIAAALAGSAAEQSPGLVGITAGLLAFTLGDYLYAIRLVENTYQPGELTDATWMLGCALIAWSVEWLHHPSRVVALYRSWLIPVGGGLLALAVLYLSDANDGHGIARTAALFTIFAAALRWVVSYRRLEQFAVLHQQASTDDLTGLRNRRSFFAEIGPLLENEQSDARITVSLVDLDGLKSVNDTLGHVAGNHMLLRAGEAMRAVAGGEATAYRLGGDEFAIVDRAPASIDSAEAAQRLQRDLEDHAPADAGLPQLRVSVGVAFFPHDAATADDLLHVADQRMYQMKALHGRGRRGPNTERLYRSNPRA
jgi:diguanylate cyclase (GGDEF)-like protein